MTSYAPIEISVACEVLCFTKRVSSAEKIVVIDLIWRRYVDLSPDILDTFDERGYSCQCPIGTPSLNPGQSHTSHESLPLPTVAFCRYNVLMSYVELAIFSPSQDASTPLAHHICRCQAAWCD